MNYVFDEHFPPKPTRTLNECIASTPDAHYIAHVKDRSWCGSPDTVWVPMAIRAGFIIVSKDRKMLTTHKIADTIAALGGKALFFAPFIEEMNKWEYMQWMFNNWRKVHADISGRHPCCCMILKSGKLKQIAP